MIANHMSFILSMLIGGQRPTQMFRDIRKSAVMLAEEVGYVKTLQP